jgi:hypothetical protein
MAFLTQTAARLCKIFIGFEKYANFFLAENWQKSQQQQQCYVGSSNVMLPFLSE